MEGDGLLPAGDPREIRDNLGNLPDEARGFGALSLRICRVCLGIEPRQRRDRRAQPVHRVHRRGQLR
jgi:hypothetical protein